MPKEKIIRVALISMPWQLFDRPSLQLGVLKAYLQTHDWITVDTFHPYLEVSKVIGTDLYKEISKNYWLSEIFYLPLAFPGQYPVAEKLVDEALKQKTVNIQQVRYKDIQVGLKNQLKSWVKRIDWKQFDLIGFSVCFNQLLSSLAAARWIKQVISASPPIVFGGSSCFPEASDQLLTNFPQIDFVVCGEGEKSLVNLCEFISKRDHHLSPQIRRRCSGSSSEAAHSVNQLSDIVQLPPPDFDDYFKEIKHCYPGQQFIPVLPIEFSRGCWWGKCAFCNLNLQWKGYRTKSADQMFNEVTVLSEKYQCLDFAFNDNALPLKESDEFFRRTAAATPDYRFFGEIRVEHCDRTLGTCREGGLNTVQMGIEALSNSLLRRMKKGATVIENIYALKNALSCGVELDANLITEFPGSTPEEIKETLRNLDFAFPFRPLSISPFYLAYGSPMDADPDVYGITPLGNHPGNKHLLPAKILQHQIIFFKNFRGDKIRQRKLWAPVVQKVRNWEAFHNQRTTSIWRKSPLSFRDGGNYLTIWQENANRTAVHYRLDRESREIYLYCMDIRSVDQILNRFKYLKEADLLEFMDYLIERRLVFGEGRQFVSLAVQEQ